MLPTSEGLAGTWDASLTPALFAHQRTLSAPRPSPDGRRFAFASEYDARTDLFVQGDGGWPVQITAAQAIAGGSYDWSPDGSRIVFTSATDGKLWLCRANGGAARSADLREGQPPYAALFAGWPRVSFICRSRRDPWTCSSSPSMALAAEVLNRGSDFPMDPSWSPDSARRDLARLSVQRHALGSKRDRRGGYWRRGGPA